MKFLVRRRRVAPAIIIISLIDVLVVLLVFLMVTTRFKNTPSVALTLPETREAPKAGAGPEKPPMIVTIAAAAPQPPTSCLGNSRTPSPPMPGSRSSSGPTRTPTGATS